MLPSLLLPQVVLTKLEEDFNMLVDQLRFSNAAGPDKITLELLKYLTKSALKTNLEAFYGNWLEK